jgi:hypothetical protein
MDNQENCGKFHLEEEECSKCILCKTKERMDSAVKCRSCLIAYFANTCAGNCYRKFSEELPKAYRSIAIIPEYDRYFCEDCKPKPT